MFWVVTEICSETNLVKRMKLIKAFIKIASELSFTLISTDLAKDVKVFRVAYLTLSFLQDIVRTAKTTIHCSLL